MGFSNVNQSQTYLNKVKLAREPFNRPGYRVSNELLCIQNKLYGLRFGQFTTAHEKEVRKTYVHECTRHWPAFSGVMRCGAKGPGREGDREPGAQGEGVPHLQPPHSARPAQHHLQEERPRPRLRAFGRPTGCLSKSPGDPLYSALRNTASTTNRVTRMHRQLVNHRTSAQGYFYLWLYLALPCMAFGRGCTEAGGAAATCSPQRPAHSCWAALRCTGAPRGWRALG
jgi:hypothetical protein